MVKKTTIFILGLTFFSAISVSAQMGGHGGHNSGGHMKTHSGSNSNNMGQMTEHDSEHGTNHQHMHTSEDMDHNTQNNHMIDSKAAQQKMRIYLDTVGARSKRLENFRDKGSHYIADVVNPKGRLLNRLVVNKKTGNVYFTKK